MAYFRFLFVCMLLVASTASAQWINGQAADMVLGQTDFLGNVKGGGATSIYAPTSIAIDISSGKLFVADIANHRVLRWPAVTSLTTGMPAEAVLGQTNFDSTSAGLARNRMNFPTAVAIDSIGRLWVADALNNRVLRFDNAASKPTGADADGVLGQPDFVSKAANTARNGMTYVRGIAIASDGSLFVSDQSNNRVLRFGNAAAKTNGADADGVLGQPDFTSSRDTVTRRGMKWPRGLAVDAQGRLFVASSGQNRVLRYDNAAAKANGDEADAVFGQDDFTSATSSRNRDGMKEANGVVLDASGRLYVADAGNNRVLWFNSAASKSNGADADGVLGQQGFVSDTAMTGQNGMNDPWACAIENERGKLWIADSGNNRILRFSASGSLLSTDSEATATKVFTLSQNYPNPLQDRTTFEYSLPRPMQVRLELYSTLGEKLRTLVDADMTEGTHRMDWTGAVLPNGMYMVVLRAGGGTAMRMITVLR